MKKIGIMGIDLDNMNKGVAALGFGLINIINQSTRDVEFFLYTETSKESIELLEKYFGISSDKVHIIPVYFRKPRTIISYWKSLKEIEFLIDITGGDSFSDIYGIRWMFRSVLPKLISILAHTNLVLAPQTYGPFKTFFGKRLASFIINNSLMTMSRDQQSIDSLKEITNKEIELMTDVAFTLPYNSDIFSFKSGKKVGINVSELLWNGGYQGNNQFGLKTDYIEFTKRIVEILLALEFQVHLISHVARIYEKEQELDTYENDLVAANKIHKMYPETLIVPAFTDPIEAKSYISNMDLFIGARMHATIAAASTSVPVIPIAYSRKFSGLYNNLNYPYVVDLTKLDTLDAVTETETYINRIDELKEKLLVSQDFIKEQVETIYQSFSHLLND